MPSTSVTDTLLKTLSSSLALWSDVRPWGVAYSGGRDSAVLLWALARLAEPGRLVALHVDHGLRPPEERTREAQVVLEWCAALGVEVRHFSAPVTVIPTEAAARDHRYRCFREFLRDHPGSPIFLAHHADDQAETVLMRILKGRSWQGLGAMVPVRGPYVRPLLRLGRDLLARVAEDQGIPFHSDSTNSGSQPARNYLRLEVFPLLRTRFPRANAALLDLAEAWRDLVPETEPDSSWTLLPNGGRCPSAVWDSWGPLKRQAQLLAVAARNPDVTPLSRRFLETAAASGRTSGASGAGWRWRRKGAWIRWESIADAGILEYFVKARPGIVYDLGSYTMVWNKAAAGDVPEGALKIPSINSALPWVWRSASAGMTWRSSEGVWDRRTRRRRLEFLGADRCALAVQGGLLKAVVDPTARRLCWCDSESEKLNNTGIFVTLGVRSDYERR